MAPMHRGHSGIDQTPQACKCTHLYVQIHLCQQLTVLGFSGGSDSKESACNAGDPDSGPGSGRSTGEGNGNPLQYSCLENSVDGGAWWTTVHGVTKSQTQLSDSHFHFHKLWTYRTA